jgi:hypothetical protein
LAQAWRLAIIFNKNNTGSSSWALKLILKEKSP